MLVQGAFPYMFIEQSVFADTVLDFDYDFFQIIKNKAVMDLRKLIKRHFGQIG